MKKIFTFYFLVVVFTFSFLVFTFSSPAFAQGTCTAVLDVTGTKCVVPTEGNKCENGRTPYPGTPPSCNCTCSLIPDYKDIDEFADFKFKVGTIGEIFSSALKYVYIFAGLGVFVYLIFGGFQLMTSGGDPAGISAGTGKITNAIIGFIIIFASYWLIQIIEVIFGMTIL